MKRSTSNKLVARELEKCLAGLTEKTRTGEVQIGGQSSQKCMRRRVCGHTTTCSDAFNFSRELHRVVIAVASDLWDVSVAFFHATIEEEVFVRPPKNQDHLETLESHVRDTGCKLTLAKVGARNVVRRPLESSHKCTVCCLQ